MVRNLQTIKDIRLYLETELGDIYPPEEIKALSNIVIGSVLGSGNRQRIYFSDTIADPEQQSEIIRLCNGLKEGIPVQYLLGETVFCGCLIKLNRETLIPRPETEELVDLVIRENRNYKGNIIDFGTGSGCIAIALAVNLPGASVTGTDNSPGALRQAGENAQLNNASISLVMDDMLELNPLFPAQPEFKAGIIVSNPPYVMLSEKKFMKRNVLDYEPHGALFADDSEPLLFYKAILRRAEGILLPGGRIYFEINETQGSRMAELMRAQGYRETRVVSDINGKDRIVKAIKDDTK